MHQIHEDGSRERAEAGTQQEDGVLHSFRNLFHRGLFESKLIEMKTDYAQIMRDIDSYKKLSREANEQRKRLEDEIGEVQDRIFSLEDQAKKNKEDMFRRMLETPTSHSPGPKPLLPRPPNPGPPSSSEKAFRDRQRIELSNASRLSAQQLIKESVRTLPGFTELVKNSELYEAFRVSYAKDLQEYYRFNTSNLNRDINQSNNKSEAVSNTSGSKAEKGKKEHSWNPGLQYNDTIKENPHEHEEEKSGLAEGGSSKDRQSESEADRPVSNIEESEISASYDQLVNVRNVPSDAHLHRKPGLPSDSDYSQDPAPQNAWEKRRNSRPSEQNRPTDSAQTFRKQSTTRDSTQRDPFPPARPPASAQDSKNPGPGDPSENRWAREKEKSGRTTPQNKTASAKEDDYATNFGNNESESEDVSEFRATPKEQFLERPTVQTATDKGTASKKDETLTFRQKDTPNKLASKRSLLDQDGAAPRDSDALYGRQEILASEMEHEGFKDSKAHTCTFQERVPELLQEEEESSSHFRSRSFNQDHIYEQDFQERDDPRHSPLTHLPKQKVNDSVSLDYSNTKKMTDEGFASSKPGTRKFRISVNSRDKFKPRDSKEEPSESRKSPLEEGSIVKNFGTGAIQLNNFEHPPSTNIFEKERITPNTGNNEIEKNFGFDTSDISLIRKESRPSEAISPNTAFASQKKEQSQQRVASF